jgi:hypothetical protein
VPLPFNKWRAAYQRLWPSKRVSLITPLPQK